eukprot:gnl/Spiro4/7232_TR3777_c0_g1_i1.p1 gnl/Spiro4/7232_TR3777_c0_g1~~gnl/Spiro4/7232_TR3777_c0_g1_i1.p1  ORF type:complete len:279 (-),score=67.26 gnl/Spiro4/7232_TR3777_c0_g1_i1:49-885(-)
MSVQLLLAFLALVLCGGHAGYIGCRSHMENGSPARVDRVCAPLLVCLIKNKGAVDESCCVDVVRGVDDVVVTEPQKNSSTHFLYCMAVLHQLSSRWSSIEPMLQQPNKMAPDRDKVLAFFYPDATTPLACPDCGPRSRRLKFSTLTPAQQSTWYNFCWSKLRLARQWTGCDPLGKTKECEWCDGFLARWKSERDPLNICPPVAADPINHYMCRALRLQVSESNYIALDPMKGNVTGVCSTKYRLKCVRPSPSLAAARAAAVKAESPIPGAHPPPECED